MAEGGFSLFLEKYTNFLVFVRTECPEFVLKAISPDVNKAFLGLSPIISGPKFVSIIRRLKKDTTLATKITSFVEEFYRRNEPLKPGPCWNHKGAVEIFLEMDNQLAKEGKVDPESKEAALEWLSDSQHDHVMVKALRYLALFMDLIAPENSTE